MFLICRQRIFYEVYFLWFKSTELDEIFSLAPNSARYHIGVARYTARKISPTPKFVARRRGPPPAPRARATPTQSHTHIVVVYPMECDHIYVNRVISHEVIVSECVTLQTLHRRFRPGTPCVGPILKTYSRQKAAGSSPRGSCSCTTMPRLTGHLQPRRNWPTWASYVLITHPILRIWSRRTTTCSLD